jgi:hypothetical protein
MCKCVYVYLWVHVYLSTDRCTSARVCRSGRHRRCAAGVTWSLVTSDALWAARHMHTTVIDAAGAMYLIGGLSYEKKNNSFYNINDVWVSANKGANRT